MVQILNDEVLEKSYCSECYKYLSYFPIKVYAGHELKCGRCNNLNDNGDFSLYQCVAKNYLFKCVNRYEGCHELLQPKDVPLHEEICIGNRYVCPLCEDSMMRTILDLIWHYKLKHYKSFLKKNWFECRLLNEDKLFYIHNDEIFFICYHYLPSSKTLYVKAATLRNLDATQKFTVISGSFAYKTEKRTCKSLKALGGDYFEINLCDNNEINCVDIIFDLNVLGVSKNPVIHQNILKMTPVNSNNNCISTKMNNLNINVKTSVSNYVLCTAGYKYVTKEGEKIECVCSNCKQFMINVYKCQKNLHLICDNCLAWCWICNTSVSCWKIALKTSLDSLRFPCRWKCGKIVPHMGIKQHELCCELNLKVCPICSKIIQVYLLQTHFLTHKKFLTLTPNLSQCFNRKDTFTSCYFLINNALVLVTSAGTEAGTLYNPKDGKYQLRFKVLEFTNAELYLIFIDNSFIKVNENDTVEIDKGQYVRMYLKFT